MSNLGSSDSNASTFYGNDAPDGSRVDGTERLARHYNRLSEYNRGVRTGRNRTNRSLIHGDDKRMIFDIVVSQLELTPHQKARSWFVLEQLDIKELSSPGGIDTYVCAFVVAAIVCREDGRMYHPNRSDNDELFVEVARNLELTDDLVRSAYGKILQEVKL